jgi:acyl-CoA thioester hydrolase
LRMKNKKFTSNFRIYYEDTDAGGVVYYANYLKFAERARTEILREAGINQSELAKNPGILFVVGNFSGNLKKPARLDDMIRIESEVTETGGASFSVCQKIFRESETIAEINVTIVCVGTGMKPERMPESVRKALS